MQQSAIHNKSFNFAIRIVRLYNFLSCNRKEFVISKQVLRSGTSIGANIRESKNAQSKADFVNKMSIALKEADETEYWIDLLYATEIIDEDAYNSLSKDIKEIIALLTSIINSAKKDN